MSVAARDDTAMRTPCLHCPFRTDIQPYLRPGRAVEISRSLMEGNTFPCHQTVDYDEDYERISGADERECAGALILLAKQGGSTQTQRIAERLGRHDPDALNMAAPVFDTFAEWCAAHRDDEAESEAEHCGVVTDDCEDPSGYGMGSGVYENPDEPMCAVWCSNCGNAMCPSCRGENDGDRPLCVYCAENQ